MKDITENGRGRRGSQSLPQKDREREDDARSCGRIGAVESDAGGDYGTAGVPE
jgi:hypothetical protein